MLYCNLIGRLFLVAPVMFSSCNFRPLLREFLFGMPHFGGRISTFHSLCSIAILWLWLFDDIMESEASSSDGSDISVEEYSGEEE